MGTSFLVDFVLASEGEQSTLNSLFFRCFNLPLIHRSLEGDTNSRLDIGFVSRTFWDHVSPEYMSRVLKYITQGTCRSERIRTCAIILDITSMEGETVWVSTGKDVLKWNLHPEGLNMDIVTPSVFIRNMLRWKQLSLT